MALFSTRIARLDRVAPTSVRTAFRTVSRDMSLLPTAITRLRAREPTTAGRWLRTVSSNVAFLITVVARLRCIARAARLDDRVLRTILCDMPFLVTVIARLWPRDETIVRRLWAVPRQMSHFVAGVARLPGNIRSVLSRLLRTVPRDMPRLPARITRLTTRRSNRVERARRSNASGERSKTVPREMVQAIASEAFDRVSSSRGGYGAGAAESSSAGILCYVGLRGVG